MPSPQDFPAVLSQLRDILKPYEPHLVVQDDAPAGYSLDAPPSRSYPKGLFFGAAQTKKNYVSFYLMPVYMYPELLDDISPELRRRMQGKSCFNFKTAEPALLEELAALAQHSFERLQKEGLVNTYEAMAAEKAREAAALEWAEATIQDVAGTA